jgi:hypothetical protein
MMYIIHRLVAGGPAWDSRADYFGVSFKSVLVNGVLIDIDDPPLSVHT